MSPPRTTVRHYWVAIRAMAIITVVLGVVYPLIITGVGQLAFPWQANGSQLQARGTIGSALIGQSFTDKTGAPLPQWFQPRPSAAADGYDAGASGGTNYGPENPKLITAIAERKLAIAKFDGVPPDKIPVDALTASASGLDPHISPAYARIQIPRIAEARNLPERDIRALVASMIQGRDLGYLGEPTVNVLELNLALAKLNG